MKTKKQFTNRMLSLVLALVMVAGMLPMTGLTAFAAANDKLFITGTHIYLKGNAATIEAGSKSGYTKIKVGGEYVDFSQCKNTLGEASFTLGNSNYEADLSQTKIAGGQSNSMTGNTNITMTGGVVKELVGSCTGYESVLTGNVNITMSGGEVRQIWGAEYGVDGNVNITVTGGKVSEFTYIIYRETTIITGDVNVIVTGGEPGTISRYAVYSTFANINGSTNLYSTVLPYGYDKDNFTNYIYRDGSNWKFGGNTATALNGNTLTIASGQTATVDSGKTLSGTIVNNGTINVKNGGTLSGTITNKGTIWGYGNIRGVTNSGSGKIIKKVTASGTNVTFNDSAWQNNSTNYDDAYTATLTVASGYVLPASVTVNVGGTTLAASNYTYNSSTGALSIPAAKITADTTVSASAFLNISDSANNVTLEKTEYTYTGNAITPAVMVNGIKANANDYTATYSANKNVGTATVTVTGKNSYTGSKTLTFKILSADVSGATVTLGDSLIYNGATRTQTVKSVKVNGITLTEGVDYTVSGNTGINAGTYTLKITGKGNFKGTKSKEFTINAATLTNIEVKQAGKLVYTGEAKKPEVSASAIAVGGQEVTFKYSEDKDGTYSKDLPSFTEAGQYTVWYQVSAPNHTTPEQGSFTVTVDKATVTEPTITSKTYTGSTLTADITDADRYTVTKNAGGKNAGKYDVVLTLKDSANYKWASDDTGEKATATLKFEITKATNGWTTEPSINHWTYGETASTPNMGVAKFGDVVVTYKGTTNGNNPFTESTTPPTEAGSYTATFAVMGNDNYTGLSKPVSFTIGKKTVDLSGVRWNYTDPFRYDGKSHTVAIDENTLPTGASVSNYTGHTNVEVGKFKAAAAIGYDDNHQGEGTLFLEWEIENNWNPTEYTVSELNSNGWLNEDFVITAEEGYKVSLTNTANGTWEDSLTYSAETDNGSVTFYLKNETDGTISLEKTVTYKLDKTAPTGKVYFDERNIWEEFLNKISFELFYKDEVTVKVVDVQDGLSDVAKIEYIESTTEMSLDDVKAAEDWTEMPENGIGVTLEDTKQFVYYVRITDNADNVTCISTNGAEYDITAPAVRGIEDGKTYYTTQKVTVTDKNIDIDSITLNDEPADSEITLDGNTETTYTVAVKDKAGNETTVTVTMKPISDLSKPIDKLTKDNVNSSNEQAVDGVKADVAAVDITNATDTEKEALKAITDKAIELEKVIDDTKAEIARINDKLSKYDSNTVNSDDAAALEQLGKDIKALTDANNLTDAERTALTKSAGDVAAMLKTIADTAAENKRISDAVDGYDLATVTSDDKANLEQLLTDINKQIGSTHLTDKERNELNGDKTAVEDLLAKIKGTDELFGKLTGDVDGYKEDTVKSTDKNAIEQLIKDIDTLLGTENLTEAEEKALENAKAKAEGLLNTIKEVTQATETKNTEKVKDVTPENVTPEDKTDFEKAKADLEKALEDNGGNYTENEKKAIEEEIKRIDDALKVIENVETVENTIGKLPKTAEPDDDTAVAAITEAKASYDALTDYEKSLVDAETKAKLDQLTAAIVAYDIIKGDGSTWTQGSNVTISLTANGSYNKFVGIKVDGKDVDKANYETESDRTGITLKASYLDTLSVGEHTITVVYTDGQTDGTFTVEAKANTPATDNGNLWLWVVVLFVIVIGIFGITQYVRKRKTANKR